MMSKVHICCILFSVTSYSLLLSIVVFFALWSRYILITVFGNTEFDYITLPQHAFIGYYSYYLPFSCSFSGLCSGCGPAAFGDLPKLGPSVGGHIWPFLGHRTGGVCFRRAELPRVQCFTCV